jgi:hypothetical protein
MLKGKRVLIIATIMGAFFLVAILAIASRLITRNLDITSGPAVSPQKPASTFEKVVEQHIIAAMGESVNWAGQPSTIVAIDVQRQAEGPDKGGYYIRVKYRANDNLTDQMMIGSVISDVMDFTQRLYADPRCASVKKYILRPRFIIVDDSGNDAEEDIARIVLHRTVADTIDWNTTNEARFIQILEEKGEFLLHPGLGASKEGEGGYQ